MNLLIKLAANREALIKDQKMRIPRRAFRDLVCDRGPGAIAVAKLPLTMGVFVSAQTETVQIQRTYAKKIIIKHRLTYEDLPIVQAAIERGFCLMGEKPRCIDFVYYDERNKPYVVVVKSANYGNELWVCTAHRSNVFQARSKTRRQKVLRHQD